MRGRYLSTKREPDMATGMADGLGEGEEGRRGTRRNLADATDIGPATCSLPKGWRRIYSSHSYTRSCWYSPLLSVPLQIHLRDPLVQALQQRARLAQGRGRERPTTRAGLCEARRSGRIPEEERTATHAEQALSNGSLLSTPSRSQVLLLPSVLAA